MESGRAAVAAIPFTAGVAAGEVLMRVSPDQWLSCSAVASLLTVFSILTLILRPRNYHVFILLFFLCGCFCMSGARVSDVFGHGAGGPAASLAEETGRMLKENLHGIPFRKERTAAILQALICGDRSMMTEEVSGIFRKSGAAHLLALSGFHLGIIYAILLKATHVLGNSPGAAAVKSTGIVSVTGLYTLATGAGDSLTRAFIFICANEFLRLTGRPRHGGDVLFTSVLVQLAVNPASLFSAGFQLSYLAMCGIVFIYPLLETWFPPSGSGGKRKGPVFRIWQGAALSVSCQLLTGPVAWYYFRSFPRYFLLSSLLGMPLCSAVMLSAIACSGFQALGHCPGILCAATESLVDAMVWTLTTISGM